jgi:hypothetical protein
MPFLFVPLSQEEEEGDTGKALSPQLPISFFGPEKELAQYEACLCLSLAPTVCQAANERGPVEEAAGSRVSACRFSPVVFESGSTHDQTGLHMPANKTLLFLRIQSTDMEYIIEYHVNATKYRWRTAAAPAPASGLHYLFVFLSSLFSVYLALFFFFPTKKQYIYRRYTPINNFEILMPRWRHTPKTY